MNTTMVTETSTSTAPEQTRRSTRAKAILAGGLILGIGAAVTLASWNDSEFATMDFAGGRFNIEGSTNGSTFTEHASAGAAGVLPLTVSAADMAPGDVVQAGYSIRLDSTSTRNAVVTVTNAASTGTLTGLTYSVTTTTLPNCGGTATAVFSDVALGTVPGGTQFPLSTGSTGNPGSPVNLCYTITAGSIAQGQSGSVTWSLAAESQ